jgi:hypothetical protein
MPLTLKCASLRQPPLVGARAGWCRQHALDRCAGYPLSTMSRLAAETAPRLNHAAPLAFRSAREAGFHNRYQNPRRAEAVWLVDAQVRAGSSARSARRLSGVLASHAPSFPQH